MIFLFLFIIFLIFYKSQFNKNGFNDDYLSKDKTLAIKGLFVILVFIRHCFSYLDLKTIIDRPIEILDLFLAQSIVSIFLFYSGYGIYEQIKKNKILYIKAFPLKRLSKLFIDFIFAIITFLFINKMLGTLNQYSLKTILLSFIGWESIGNSNWYIFYTFITYIFIIIAFNIFKNNDKRAIIFIIFLTLIYSILMLKFKNKTWMDTSFCFSLGMIYSYFKTDIEKFIQKNKTYIIFFCILLISYLILNIIYYKIRNPYIYIVISSVFSLLVVMITMKFTINCKFFEILGKNVFWIYILQRIPMIILSNLKMQNHQYLFLILSFLSTIIIAEIYKYIIDNKIIKIIYK